MTSLNALFVANSDYEEGVRSYKERKTTFQQLTKLQAKVEEQLWKNRVTLIAIAKEKCNGKRE